MPPTGDPSRDIPELERANRGRKKKRPRKQVIAIALAEQRRLGKALSHPWVVSKGMGRFDPSQHPRGQPENAGEFTSAGGGAGSSVSRHNPDLDALFDETPAKPKAPPAGGGSSVLRHNPDLDALFDGEPPKPKATPAGDIRSNGPDIFADHPAGTQPVNQMPGRTAAKPPGAGLHNAPHLPHVRTQHAALLAARHVKPGDARSHAAAVQALDAHLKAGLAEIRRRAAAAGPRAGNVYRKAAEAFKAKMSDARRRVDAMAGKGPPPVPSRGGPRGSFGRRPPPLPAAHRVPPRLADRGKVAPWVPLTGKALHPWVVTKASDGRWITIGGSKGADGKRHGGSPVFIKDGKIVKGHPSLTGKTIGSLKDGGGDKPAPGSFDFNFGALEKSLAVPLPPRFPWIVHKARDASGHEHGPDGRWAAGGSTTHERLHAAVRHTAESKDTGDHAELAAHAGAELKRLSRADLYKLLASAKVTRIAPGSSKKALLAAAHAHLTARLRARLRAEV